MIWAVAVAVAVCTNSSCATSTTATHADGGCAAIRRTAVAGRRGGGRTNHNRRRRQRTAGRPTLVRAERPRLVLGLGAPQSRLLSHHALPIGRQHALLAVAEAKLAVALVAFEYDLFAMVAATRTIRRRSGRPGANARAGRTAAQIRLLVGRLGVDPALVRYHRIAVMLRCVLLGRQFEVGLNGETGGGEVIEHRSLHCCMEFI